MSWLPLAGNRVEFPVITFMPESIPVGLQRCPEGLLGLQGVIRKS